MATIRPGISEASIHSGAMRGKVLRQLRERLGMSQKQMAPVLGLTRSSLHHLEARDSAVPATVAAGIRAIQAAQVAGASFSLPKKTNLPWRDSRTFQQRPPFEVPPPNGTACGCHNPRCGLKPVRDGDWSDRGHLWIFQGRRCDKRGYLDASGQKVPSPRRAPVEVCSGCGRSRELGPKYSTRLGEKYWTTACRPRPNDSPSSRHDPPTHWWKRNGKFERLPQKALGNLHGRSKRSFPAPTCNVEGCPRFGINMPISAVLHLGLRDGGRCQIAMFRCRAPKPHSEYRALPHGEVAARIAIGRYRWTDNTTGSSIETRAKKRPISKDRIMPASQCPGCHAKLCFVDGPRKVIKTILGRRQWKGRLRRWKAQCASCDKVFFVRSDGEIRPNKDPRWRKANRGLVAGAIVGDTKARITVAANLGTMAPSVMASHLYPKQTSRGHARHSAVVFLGRQRGRIELEQARLASLSATQREVEIEDAKQQLSNQD